MLFYILSRLGSGIRRGLACYFISYDALAVSAEDISSHALAVSAGAYYSIS